MNAELAAVFDTQLQQAREHVAASRLEAAYGCLERAHVLGQWHTLPHLRTHWGLLQLGVRRRDVREIVGQMLRLVAALIATPVGLVPAGNTGGARVSPWRTMPIEPDAKRLLRSDPRSARGLEKR